MSRFRNWITQWKTINIASKLQTLLIFTFQVQNWKNYIKYDDAEIGDQINYRSNESNERSYGIGSTWLTGCVSRPKADKSWPITVENFTHISYLLPNRPWNPIDAEQGDIGYII